MTVVTRFAPSPTGFLHIGSARTALFNWLYAKHTGGKFLLRIEDTDRERSTQAATDALISGLDWMGIHWDGEIIHQFSRAPRHAEVARQLLAQGKAYECYTSAAELAALREQGKNYDRKWRDSRETPPAGVKPVIRIKAPLSGSITVIDRVLGESTVDAAQLDDMVLLRSDGTPTYMLAVVVDDHDMGVTHVIRGSDHFTNTFRQRMIYDALGWNVPEFAHIPLIHGADGAKLSKRHGAIGVEAYRDMGYLPETLRNYLLRLGWSHGDEEVISDEQAKEWFDLGSIGKSASRFDFAKLDNLNGHYIREADNARLASLIVPFIIKKNPEVQIDEALLTRAMGGLKQRAKTLVELADNALFYLIKRPIILNDKAKALLTEEAKTMLRALIPELEALSDWSEASTQEVAKRYVEAGHIKLGIVAQPLRAALSGSNVSPGVFDVMAVLGKQETLARLRDVC